MRKPTIKDVSKLSGFGIGTVSRVLNGGSVKASTKEKVVKAMKKLDYRPNTSARTLAGGKSKRILFLMPEVRTEFHWRAMKAFDDVLDERNYEMIIYPIFSGKRLERLQNDFALLQDTDGAVFCSINIDFLLNCKIDFGKNIVLFESQSDEFDCVYLDNFLGGKYAAQLLLEAGANEFFTVTFQENNPLFATENFDKRLRGFAKTLKNAGYELGREHIIYTSFFYDCAYEKIEDILSGYEKPGIFALADNFALEVLQTAAAMKKIPGKDFFLVGYDNQSIAERAGLTTINQPIEEMGKKMAELIIDKIERPVPYIRPVKFLPEIIRRRTT